MGPKNEQKKLGGNRAALFVYAMEGLEYMAFMSSSISLVVYFSGQMNFSITKSATITNFMGSSFLLALFGGFLSDTFLSRFNTVVLFATFEVLGYAILTIQAHFDNLRPTPCKGIEPDQMNRCEAPTSGQEAMLFFGLYLVALGTSGIKSALPAFGADQFDENDTKEAVQLSSFFNWFVFSLTSGALIGVTFVVWISTNQGWDWSFAVCTLAVLVSVLILCTGKSRYRHNSPQGSILTRLAQVFVVAIRNRNLPIPDSTKGLHEIYDKEAGKRHELIKRTNQFRFLDKASVVRLEQGESSGPWRLCTVTQIEETKILIRMLPIILSTVFLNTCLAQLQTFTIQQSTTMDTNLLGFRVPGPSIPAIRILSMLVMIPIYDRIFAPLARKLTGVPTGVPHLQRIGAGLVLSAISMAVAGVVETRRKSIAIEHNMVDSNEPLPISVFWLGFQYGIFGVVDEFAFVGLLEFFYSESSAGMKSLSAAISWCSIAIGYFTSSVTVEIVNKATGGWLANNNLNRDKLNYFYWLLAVLSVVNFGFYLVCASWYKYKKVEVEEKQVENSMQHEIRGNGGSLEP